MAAVFQYIVDAHAAVQSDGEVDLAHVHNSLVCFAVAFIAIAAFHRVVAARVKRQYFLTHVFANIIITLLTVEGAVRSLFNPMTSTAPGPAGGGCSTLYLCWIYAIHIYHPIFFATGRMDWIHHVPVYILNTLMFSVRSLPTPQTSHPYISVCLALGA